MFKRLLYLIVGILAFIFVPYGSGLFWWDLILETWDNKTALFVWLFGWTTIVIVVGSIAILFASFGYLVYGKEFFKNDNEPFLDEEPDNFPYW